MSRRRRSAYLGATVLMSGIMSACGESAAPGAPEPNELSCVIPIDQIFDGGPGKDGIPALNDPRLVDAAASDLEYLRDDDRVIGLLWNGQAIAVPHNVGWWHEIVNLDLDGLLVAVSFCPLTGSSMAFDRAPADGATFGVSGLLYQNNLIMYDRNQPESLWPQMARGARCGERSGSSLNMVPVIEMTWAGWRGLYPETQVVPGADGLGRDYAMYPYGSYDVVGNDDLLFPLPNVDRRRPLKERVLGIPEANGEVGIAFPFGELAKAGLVAAIHYDAGDDGMVVFWDGLVQGAMAFRPAAGGQALNFEVRSGAIEDRETGSTWSIDGHARSGPLQGERLEPVAEAYVAFWFAWAAFHGNADLWTEAGIS